MTTLTKRMAEDLTQYYQELGVQGPLPALGHRHARAHRDPARPAPRRRSTCWSASTCCARGSTCRRSRWSRFWTPTRKASCARPASLIQTIGRAARNVQRPRHPVRRPHDRFDAARRSARPTAAARSRRRTTREHGITPASIVQEHRRRAVERLRARLRDGADSAGRARAVPDARRARGASSPGCRRR